MEDSSNKLLLAKIEDEVKMTIRDYKALSTSFCDPSQAKIVEQTLRNIDDIQYFSFGGHMHAERVVYVIFPQYMQKPDFTFIDVLRISWDSQYNRVEHRDILGALIGFGIKREKIGDIIMDHDFAHVFISKELSSFVASGLDRVGRAVISVKVIPCDELVLPDPKVKTIRTTVASPRLDSIISACFQLSRSKAVPYITSGKVRVNWNLVEKPDHIVSPGDILSIRGLGRGKLIEFQGTTRKDRLFVSLEKYI
ncbi:MAG: RNA-binding protein [Clostridiales bacterium]|nr:RNA-binding protein [Clostridiales bacterium]